MGFNFTRKSKGMAVNPNDRFFKGRNWQVPGLLDTSGKKAFKNSQLHVLSKERSV